MDENMAVNETVVPNENPNHESSSSSSDSDSDSDSDTASEEQIQALVSQLKENPWNYDAHVKCIQLWRKLGNIEKLRESRQTMDQYFPLSSKMWQEWANDEANLNSSTEAFADIERLYERGVNEYLSVPLWCDYLNFVQERDQLVAQCEPDGIQKMRNLYERALAAAGLHVVHGGKIWEAYREYEQAIFLTMEDDGDNEEKSKQLNRIRSLFHRQLSIPLADLKSTLVNYKLWEVDQGNTCDLNSDFDGVPTNVVSAYQKAMDMLNARKTYEEQLSKSDASDTDKLECFMSYMKFEESSGDPARVQILYERAVSTLPLFSELWLSYTIYLDNTLKVPNIVKDVYSRAVRNCSWVGNLWVRYMLSLERLRASEKELSSVFERSIQCVFGSFEEYLDVFLTRVDGLRRMISIEGVKDNELNYCLIRETFQRAAEYFSLEMIRTDDLLHLYDYWARLESTIGEDILAARGVWENLLKKSGSLLEAWQGYIKMEIGLGHISEARSIYKRCYTKRLSGAGSEEICHSWLRFEREYGTLEDYDLAVKKVTPRLQELDMFKTQQESKRSIPLVSTKENNSTKAKTPQKRKMTKAATNDKQPPPKRRKDAAAELVETSSLDHIEKSKNLRDTEMLDNVNEEALPSEVDNKADKSAGDSKQMKSKPTMYKDQCTAYISNISLEAREEHLRKFFEETGGVTAIRILKDKFTGKSRGLAYVDFSDEEHLASAIAKNKQRLLGQKLSIARSDPQQSKKRASASASSSRGRGRGAVNKNDRSSSRPDSGESEVKLIGKNTFAAPRNLIRPLGVMDVRHPKAATEDTEVPKSNDEFRAMLLKK